MATNTRTGGGASELSSEVANAWWRLWSIAVLAHMLSNIAGPSEIGRGFTNGAVGALALAVLVRADHCKLRFALAGGVVISVLVDAPFVGNHWWLAGIVSLVAIVARPARPDWWTRFAPAARIVFLVFYSFAAFAKLNHGFFDPVASCSRYFANRTLELWQLPELGGGSSLATLLPYATFGIEASVPLLLLFRRTRKAGVLLAIAFHLVITLDLRQHFFDFTLVLLPLFLLFVPDGTLVAIEARLPRLTGLTRRVLVGVVAVSLVIIALPIPRTVKAVPVLMAWLGWIVLFVLVVAAVFGTKWSARDRSLRPDRVMLPLIALVVLNGLSPYLELKSATGFNMYANLVTADGDTNHFVIPRTAHLRDQQDTLAVIVETNDEDLEEYVDSGFALPIANLDRYLSDHPDTSAVVEIDGQVVNIAAEPEREYSGNPGNWLANRFLLFRALPMDEPATCQPSFLIAQ